MPQFRNSVMPPGVVLMVLLAIVSAGCADREEMLRVRNMTINDVDPVGIVDGSYPGEFTCGNFTYVVMTTVERGRIRSIDVLPNRRGRSARKAEAIIPRIIEAQTPNVEAVTGATTTSKALMKAVENSLRNAPRH